MFKAKNCSAKNYRFEVRAKFSFIAKKKLSRGAKKLHHNSHENKLKN
jgi:hypothetical protein